MLAKFKILLQKKNYNVLRNILVYIARILFNNNAQQIVGNMVT